MLTMFAALSGGIIITVVPLVKFSGLLVLFPPKLSVLIKKKNWVKFTYPESGI